MLIFSHKLPSPSYLYSFLELFLHPLYYVQGLSSCLKRSFSSVIMFFGAEKWAAAFRTKVVPDE